ncbi:MAG: outer membrane lipoprotein carrier protein LolA [Cytophagales bacterium]|nr:outer membrane lipoprotein carrier protein LolA [Cytophagales bacterium]
MRTDSLPLHKGFFVGILFLSFLHPGLSTPKAKVVPLQSGNPKTKQILESLSKRYQASGLNRLDFIYTIENPSSDQKEEVIGTVYFQGKNYKLELNDQHFYYDGKTFWNHLISSKEVNVQELHTLDENIIRGPQDILNLYQKGFKYRTLQRDQDKAEIELIPKDKDRNFFKVKLGVDIVNHKLLGFSIFYRNGNKHQYRVRKEYEIGPTESIDFFRFNAKVYPDVEIIDLR